VAFASNPDEFALMARGMSTGSSAFRAGDEGRAAAELDMKALLARATEQGASDLHLAAGRPAMVRVDGGLRPIDAQAPELSDGDLRTLLYSIMSNRQRSQFELERELDFAIAVDGGRRFRVNAYFQRGRMAAALRAMIREDAAATRRRTSA
jgi:twitching motility protein PilT